MTKYGYYKITKYEDGQRLETFDQGAGLAESEAGAAENLRRAKARRAENAAKMGESDILASIEAATVYELRAYEINERRADMLANQLAEELGKLDHKPEPGELRQTAENVARRAGRFQIIPKQSAGAYQWEITKRQEDKAEAAKDLKTARRTYTATRRSFLKWGNSEEWESSILGTFDTYEEAANEAKAKATPETSPYFVTKTAEANGRAYLLNEYPIRLIRQPGGGGAAEDEAAEAKKEAKRIMKKEQKRRAYAMRKWGEENQ